MGRLANINKRKGYNPLQKEVNFVNEAAMKENKRRLHEDRFASIEDELNAIENGGWDAFDNSDLADPIMADRIHQNASIEGRSDLDYVNHEDLLDDIEDDFAYEIECGGDVNYAETPFSGFKDIFDEMKAELEANGEVYSSYGRGYVITEVDDLANEVLEMEIDAIYEEWGISMPVTSDINHYSTMERALKHLAPYANDNYPNCKGFFETLMNISKEYNATVTELNLSWPPLVRIPDQSGTLEENAVSNSLPPSVDNFLQDVAQMYGGIDYTDIMHFAKKATDTEVKKIQALNFMFKDNADDEEIAEEIAKKVASFVKDSLVESKRKPSKKALNGKLYEGGPRKSFIWADYSTLYDDEKMEKVENDLTNIIGDFTFIIDREGDGKIVLYADKPIDDESWLKAKNIFKTAYKESSKARFQGRVRESCDVSTVEGLTKYSKDIASAVLDGKLYDSNAVLAICSMLHCNEDYAAECLDAWIETEQMRRADPNTMIAESVKKLSKSLKKLKK